MSTETPQARLFVSQPSTGMSSTGDGEQDVRPVVESKYGMTPRLSFTWRETWGRGEQEKDLIIYNVPAFIIWLVEQLAASEKEQRERAVAAEKATEATS